MPPKPCEDLERGKICQVLPDVRAATDGYLRVVHEAGEDYLYRESYFSFLDLPDRPRLTTAA